MPDNSKRTGAALEAHYQFLLWLLPAVEKFPRNHKFTLGDRIEGAALDVLEALIDATYTRDRADALRLRLEEPIRPASRFSIRTGADRAGEVGVRAAYGVLRPLDRHASLAMTTLAPSLELAARCCAKPRRIVAEARRFDVDQFRASVGGA